MGHLSVIGISIRTTLEAFQSPIFAQKKSMSSITVKALAEIIQGKVEGDPDREILAPSKIEEGTPHTISFLGNMQYESHLYQSQAAAVIVSNEFQPKEPVHPSLIRVEDVYQAVAQLLKLFEGNAQRTPGVANSAIVEDSVRIDDTAYVGAGVVIEAETQIGANTVIFPQVFIGKNVQIGANCQIHPGVRIYANSVIGDHCIIQANAVIGSEGFGFAPTADGSFKKIAQIGNVILEDHVDIGANTVIDRATMGSTRIEAGAKLDNLIQIAHNVTIGSNTVIAAQAGIAGSTQVGQGCMIGGQAGLVGHITMADGTKVQAQSGVNKSIKEPNTALYGSPVLAYNDYLRAYSVFRKLPHIERRVRELEKAGTRKEEG